MDDNECCVCYETFESKIKCVLPCNHTICLQCTLKLKTKTCVMCRQDISDCFPEEEQETSARVTFQVVTRPVVAPMEDVQLESLLNWIRRNRLMQDELRNLAISRLSGGISRSLFQDPEREDSSPSLDTQFDLD